MKQEQRQFAICGITIYRILAYFSIYSVLGYVLETLFALVMYGKLESRQGFLYGPVCPIYGVGAVVMIVALQKFKKNGYTLFLGGFLVGSVVEYIISLIGEIFLNVRWWDYSDRFLNINGRVCLLYSLYWGIVGLYLMKSLNPNIDKTINFFRRKINIKFARILVVVITIVLFIDCVISASAVELFLSRVVVEKDLPAQNKQVYIEMYENYSNSKAKPLIDKFWGNRTILRAYPNIRLTLEDGKTIYVREQYPDIQTYYYKFRE